MTFPLFLARRTEFAFNIGHFLKSFCRFMTCWPLFKFLFLSCLIFFEVIVLDETDPRMSSMIICTSDCGGGSFGAFYR